MPAVLPEPLPGANMPWLINAYRLKRACVGEAGRAAVDAEFQAIRTEAQAAAYIREVEAMVAARRRQDEPPPGPGPGDPRSDAAAARPRRPAIPPRRGAVVAALVLAILAAAVAAAWGLERERAFLAVLGGLAALMLALGWGTTGRLSGLFINERNLMSLARLQTAVWTALVLAAFAAVAAARIKALLAGTLDGNPLAIAVDPDLWLLLGISTGSLVGSSLILATKRDQDPASAVTGRTAAQLGMEQAEVEDSRQGLLYGNPSPGDARMTDLFEGDELADTARLDLAKVQMFLFTAVAAIAFAAQVVAQLRHATAPPAQLPAFQQGFLALLGISHAGYLTSKAVTRTRAQDPD